MAYEIIIKAKGVGVAQVVRVVNGSPILDENQAKQLANGYWQQKKTPSGHEIEGIVVNLIRPHTEVYRLP